MPKTLFFLLILVISILPGCSKNNKDLVVGNWASDVASQREGIDEEISHYNYLEVTKSYIKFKSYYIATQDNKTVKQFNETNKSSNYELKPGNKIMIDDKVYEIKLRKNEMTIKNENVEIHYNREKN